jgi:hypothetical protein
MYRRATRRVLVGSIAAVAAVLATLGGAGAAAAAQPPSCATLPSGGDICLQVTNDPNPVSVSTPASATFLSSKVDITNHSGQTVTQLTYTLGPVVPATASTTERQSAFALQALPSGCTYSSSSQLVTCLPPQVCDQHDCLVLDLAESADGTGPVTLTSTLSFKESGKSRPRPGQLGAAR